MGGQTATTGAILTTPEAVGKRIHMALEYKGWTVADLRRRLDESSAKVKGYTALYVYARGEKSPPLEFFEDAARELEVEIGWLALGVGYMTKSVQTTHEVAHQTIDEAIDRLVNGPGLPVAVRSVREGLAATLKRKAEIEEVVLGRSNDDLEAVRREIVRRLPEWALGLANYVVNPKAGLDWDLADPWDMHEQEWLSCAGSRLEGIRQGMPESYRKARILSAGRDRKTDAEMGRETLE